ncbi:hypothetical protein [Fictibacillus barbaricus]|uniref:Uncharacterized protein n=1 Tax=Fictibacillus barbaricus TaxID=182136 RepID=A0ABU1U5B4_9BACL|nr:hypothetical protein [Fictibacillus barbaricus]MDR7074680.1 hypothetical protein [Fictibacillus barbaricus]
MVRHKKSVTEERLEIGKLEFVFEPGFEKDWAKVIASYIYFQIKDNLIKEVGDLP